MRVAVLVATLAAAVGCGTSAGAPSAPTSTTSLTITYWAQGVGTATPVKWTLRCSPAAGTLPRAAAACSRLGTLKRPFAPIPADAICTEQYGGPQVAVITGTFRGQRLWTKLQNRNGCEIARFKRLGFLVPAYGSGSAA